MTKEKKEKVIRTWLAVLKFTVLLLILVGTPLLFYFRFPEVLEHLNSMESINAMLAKYHIASIFIYIGLQIVQVILAFLPGQVVQFAAGYAYGVLFGFLLTIIGVTIGTFCSFSIGKLFGKDIVYLIFGDDRLKKFVKLLNSKKAFVAIFFIYLFPGLPKDVFTYAAGVSEIKRLPFLCVSVIARSPAMLMSILVGDMYRNGSYVGIIIVSVIVVAIAILGIIKRKRVFEWVDKIYYRFFAKPEPTEETL